MWNSCPLAGSRPHTTFTAVDPGALVSPGIRSGANARAGIFAKMWDLKWPLRGESVGFGPSAIEDSSIAVLAMA